MEQLFRRQLKQTPLLVSGQRLLVGLSGGPDSVALLHLLQGVAAEWSLTLFAAHLDHGIRPDSSADVDLVRRLCATLRVPLTVERVDIPALALGHRTGLEETARDERRAFLLRAADGLGCDLIALGHHRGDQAETLLQRLLRGSGSTGLAAMRVQHGRFIRPLLGVAKAELLAYLHQRGLAFVSDATNTDCSFTRNRIRHQLLPLLQEYNPRIEEHLAGLAQRLALEEDYWHEQEVQHLATLAQSRNDGLWLERGGLLALHPALRVRVLRRALIRVRGNLEGIAAVHLAAVETLLQSERPQGELHLPGLWLARRYGQLWLRQRPPEPLAAWSLRVEGPGRYPLPGGDWLVVELTSCPRGEGLLQVEYDAALVRFPLELRQPRPGDRFRPSGLEGHKKLKDFFVDTKLGREQRRALPLVTAGEIIWLVGVRRCEGLRPSAAGGQVLRLLLERPVLADNWLVQSQGV